MRTKLFIGQKVRALRLARGWKLAQCAEALGLSASYLSQIEADLRPASQRVLLAITDVFDIAASSLDAGDAHRQVADLREALTDAGPDVAAVALSELRQAAAQAPNLVRRFLDLHRINRQLVERLNATDEAVSLDEAASASALLPYEEVRDYFHFRDNYIDTVDTVAEGLAATIANGADRADQAFEGFLADAFSVTVSRDAAPGLLRRYDPIRRRLSLNPLDGRASQRFQLAYQIAALSLGDLIEEELARAGFRSREAADVCRVAIGNYAAGALMMPYAAFAASARVLRHDTEQLTQRFGASLEQVCHRLSTLQRPGTRGLPLYFVRADLAGNITKRHSATRFQFARFGGSCPLWNLHEAVVAPDRFHVQIAEMPDGVRYLCVARAVLKPSGAYGVPDRRYVLGFGCELGRAKDLVYSDGLDLKGPPTRIGVSCRICERDECAQRAFPPVDRRLTVPLHEREVVPFRL